VAGLTAAFLPTIHLDRERVPRHRPPRLTRSFLENPEVFLTRLLEDR
jgi:hypothetical protein